MKSGQSSRSAYWRIAGFAVVFAAIATLAASDAMHAATLRFVGQMAALLDTHPVAGACMFVVFAALSAMLAFVSAALAVPVAVYSLGQPATAGLLWLGWILGGVCAHSVGRFLGRPVVSTLAGAAALARFEHRLHANTPFGLILLLQLALPSELPGYLLGMLRYPLRKYLVALAIVELPYAVATTYLGASFLHGKATVIVGIGVLGVIVSIGALQMLRNRIA
jgi:uncharacterized membrane protein YdjX (TVP38/TMEM64 family)